MKNQLKKIIVEFSTNKIKTHANKIKNQEGLYFYRVILLAIFLFLSLIVLYPLAKIVIHSFMGDGSFSIRAYRQVFLAETTYRALFNTAQLICIALFVAWGIGFALAFIRIKTNFRYKKAIDFSVFLSFGMPSYILSVAWLQIMGQGGWLNRVISLFNSNASYEFNPYSIVAAGIVMGVHLYPLVYYGLSNSFLLLNNQMEQSASICGSGKKRVIFTVSIPLIAPSFISTGLLVISRTIANFAVTAQLAMPSGQEVLTTRIFSALSDLDLTQVAVLSLFLIVISFGLYLITNRIMKEDRYQFESSGFKLKNVFELGKMEWLINCLFFGFMAVIVIFPFITIIATSFLKRWGLPLSWEFFTLNNYKLLFFENQLILKPLINSLVYGFLAATVGVVIATVITYFYKYEKSFLSKSMMGIAVSSVAFPNMIIAIGATFAWINEPLKLYGTKWIIIIAYLVLFIPISVKQISGATKNIDGATNEVAKTMGIPVLSRIFRIFVPQIKNGLIAAYLLCFIISLREVPISLLLYSADTKTLGVLLFTIQSNSYGLEMTSAIAVIVIILSLLGNIILRKLGGKGVDRYE